MTLWRAGELDDDASGTEQLDLFLCSPSALTRFLHSSARGSKFWK